MSSKVQENWFDAELRKARQKDAQKVAKRGEPSVKLPEKSPAQKPQQRMSMRDRILAATQGIGTASNLRTLLQDAKECQASQEVVDRFVALVREIDELAIYKLSQETSEYEARQMWESMTWDDRKNRLADWANQGDKTVEARMLQLPLFYEFEGVENVPTKIFLQEIIDQFVHPLAWINTRAGLKNFLDGLVEVEPPKTPLVKRIIQKYQPQDDKCVLVKDGKDNLLYLPKAGVNKIGRAWPYIKEAEARVKSVEDDMAALRHKATPDFTPVKISRGEEGKLFLSLSGKEAVLMEAKRQKNGEVTVEIAESVGVEKDLLPKEPQLWNKRRHQPASTVGSWRCICGALSYWKDQVQACKLERKKARDSFLAPLMEVATLPARFEDQGLTRIFKGERETVALWRDHFHWGRQDQCGFFGIAVEHCENGTYILKEVVSGFSIPFPKELIGEKLPLVVDHNEPSFRLDSQLPRMAPGRMNGLKMVLKLLEIRLREEALCESQ